MKIKKLLMSFAALAAGLGLASCDDTLTGNNGNASTPEQTIDQSTIVIDESKSATANYQVPKGGLDKTKTMTITFYSTMGDSLQKICQEAIDKFQEDYPNITIDHQSIGGYDDVLSQIQTEIGEGNQPNIAYCYSDHVASYNRAKAVTQLDALISDPTYGLTEEEINDFIPGYFNEGKSFGDGYMYTLPYSKSSEVLYYNKTEFEKNGWDITKASTWEGMMELCEEIKQKYPESIPLGIDSEANLFITLCEQAGTPYTSATGNHFLFNNAENKEIVSKFKEWFDKGYFTTQSILTTYTSSLFTATDTKRSFMSIGSTGGASHQYSTAFECGITTIPRWDASKELKVISQGPSLCIFQKDNPQEVLASWIFVTDYLLATEYQVEFAMASGYNPVKKSCYSLEIIDPDDPLELTTLTYNEWLEKAKGTSANGTIALAARVCGSMTDSYYTSPAFKGSSKARIQVGDMFVAAISGTKTIDKAFADAILECED